METLTPPTDEVRTPAPVAANARRRHLLLGAAAFVVLAGLVPYTVVAWRGTSATTTNILLALTLVTYGAGRLCWTLTRRRGRFLLAMCFVFIYVFVGVASLAQVVARRYPLDNRDYTADAVTRQLLVLLIGCLALELGLLVADRLPQSTRSGPAARFGWTFSPTRAAAVGLVGVAFVSVQIYQHGILAFFVSRQQTVSLLAGVAPGGLPYYTAEDKVAGLLNTLLNQYLVFLALLIILYCRRHKIWPPPGPYASLAWRVLIGLLVIANLVMNNPIGNARLWFCLVLVGFASVYINVRKPGNLALYVGGALAVLLFAFTYLDAFRSTGPTNAVMTYGLTNESYPVLQMGLNGDEYVDAYGHTHGRQLAGALLSPVPRRFWPDKPTTTGQVVDPQYVRSASAWTELYVDFGTTGVVVFFLGYGFVVRRIEQRADRSGPGAFLALYPLIGTYQLFLLRGSFQPAIGLAYQLVFVLVLMSSLRTDTSEVVAP